MSATVPTHLWWNQCIKRLALSGERQLTVTDLRCQLDISPDNANGSSPFALPIDLVLVEDDVLQVDLDPRERRGILDVLIGRPL